MPLSVRYPTLGRLFQIGPRLTCVPALLKLAFCFLHRTVRGGLLLLQVNRAP